MTIIIFFLIFGLSSYYSKSADQKQVKSNTTESSFRIYEIIFIGLYILSILSIVTSVTNPNIYSNWAGLSLQSLVRLVFSIFVAFFAPGYVISSFLIKNHWGIMPRALSCYLLSLLVTGLVGYFSAVSDTAAGHLRDYILLANIFLLTVFIIHKLRNWSKSKKKNFLPSSTLFLLNKSKILVFCALICVVILSTYIIVWRNNSWRYLVLPWKISHHPKGRFL